MRGSSAARAGGDTGNIKVFCRFRPLNEKELGERDNRECVTYRDAKTCAVQGVNKQTGCQEQVEYSFDTVFRPESTQEEVYDTAVLPIVESVLTGYNGTILAYG